jgi:hypothetical protein
MSAKLTTQEFIDRARAVHGDKYGYAFSVYQSAHTKVFIHCSEHGMFEQIASNHVTCKSGCPDCSVDSRKLNRECFIEKAREVHGNKYDYSLVEYVNTSTKVKIKCTTHGLFEQSAYGHLRGNGCSSCSNNKKHTVYSFIKKAREVHGNKYDYSLVDYVNLQTRINITCHEHGIFEQTPDGHLSGNGCPICADKTHSNTSFITLAREVHGNKYDYSLVNYVNAHKKIVISCPDHGDFEQKPHNHLRGSGCLGCANYGFDRTKKGYLYILRSDCGTKMKIGITNKPDQRQAQLSRATPFLFNRIELIEGPGDQIADLEKELLAEYEPVEFTETFDGSTEWRLWSDSIRNKVKKDLRP